jgi:5'-nucleotidase
MTVEKTPLILLTNDDGIQSSGIVAAALHLRGIGQLVVAAPREQQTSSGRSLPTTTDGMIERVKLPGGEEIEAYAIGGTPAQSVLHALLEILPRRPDLVVSGINYGENVGSGVTISGTVGAALEAAALGIPALAVSLQIMGQDWYAYHDLDFSAAADITARFARGMLARALPADVDLLKVDVPADATPQTPWRITRQSRQRYYMPYLIRNGDWKTRGFVSAKVNVDQKDVETDSDVYALVYDKVVSVTPISIDLTSRTDFSSLAMLFEGT